MSGERIRTDEPRNGPQCRFRGVRSHLMRAGQVYLNDFGAAGGVELPFGGLGQSGFGREKGMEALRSFSTLKTVISRHG